MHQTNAEILREIPQEKSATILLVEDDESLQEGIRDLIEVAIVGYDLVVITAVNGQDGLKTMETITPDLIISDIMMPKMDGYQFLKAVRKVPIWVHVPFIFLTAKGSKKDMQMGRLSGAELYITKPFNSVELLDLVKSQLDRKFELQELRQKHMHSFKRSMLQLLNHEFRTPLTYVTAYYEMLADSLSIYEDMENMEAYLEGIRAGCTRLTGLVNDLILVMDIRTGDAAQAFENERRLIHDVEELLRQVSKQAWEESEYENIEFHYSIASDLSPIKGHEDQLNIVLTHLIKNAIKFVSFKEGNEIGFIEIAAAEENGELKIAISDNGIGISPSAHTQIFDLFYQHNRHHYEQQGSGSGLHIAKCLAEIHGGRIEVESVENEYSRFTLVLPANADLEIPHADRSPEAAERSATILIVEDDYYLLDGLRELLELYAGPYSLNIVTAADGQAGLAAVEQNAPDLILSDIMMPNMDGYEFLTTIRKNPDWVHIPFIFLTAKGERRDIHRGRQSGAEQYITKPYDSDELLNLITAQLNRYFELQGLQNKGFESLKQNILQLLQSDFLGPLDLVATHSQTLSYDLKELDTPQDLKESLKGIKQGSGRLSELVEDFISLAEIKTGEAQHVYNVRAVPIANIGMIMKELTQQYYFKYVNSEITVHSEAVGSLPPVKADYDSITSVVKRLFDILLDQCRENNQRDIYFSTQATAEQVCLILRTDVGNFTANAAKQMQALFEDDNERIMNSVPFGPNLCIVNGIIKVHQGYIEFSSEPEIGDTFKIYLPIHKE